MKKTVILGAGLAGLSAAYHLQSEYEIYEAGSESGGAAGSFTAAGFTFDHAIHILYTKDPYICKLLRHLLRDNYSEQTRSSWIYSHNKYIPYPYQANMKGLPGSIIMENILGLLKVKFAIEKPEPGNFEEWIMATFGKGIARNFMLPFNRKVWAADPTNMSAEWIEERVPVPRLLDVLKGIMRRESTTTYGPNNLFWYPRQGGMASLAKSFLRHINNVRYQSKCIRIETNKKIAYFNDGKQCTYTTLISSLPLPMIISLIGNIPFSVAIAASKLRANRVSTVNIGVAREKISDKHWVYFPEDQFLFQRISFPANFSASLAPKGASSVMAEISSSAFRPLPRVDIAAETITQLRRIGILRNDDEILIAKVVQIDPAYIIYDNDHREAVKTIHNYLRSVSIIPCGRFGEWEYFNMDHTILSGKKAAEEVDAINKNERILS
jgi:UDP-galactopyranose mutase